MDSLSFTEPDHENIPGYTVRVYISSNGQWSDTKIVGRLKLVKMQNIDVPLQYLRVFGYDDQENVRDCVLEYELPLNFNYSILSEDMSSL